MGSKPRKAGMGAAVAVLAVVVGLVLIIGVILLMMWLQPGIEHSPAQALQLVPRTLQSIVRPA
jgi:flagellar biogenesis protein FliO